MSEVLHANIFFFITGVAVIVCSALLCVALFHTIKVLKSARRIMDRVEAGTEAIAEDIAEVRAYFTDGGFVGRVLAALFGGRARRQEDEGTTRSRSSKRSGKLVIKDE